MNVARALWFGASLVIGRMIRRARYSRVVIEKREGAPVVRKRRAFYAPALLTCGNIILKVLGAGVRILPHAEWTERERGIYRQLHDAELILAGRTLVVPFLAGRTLASLLDDPSLSPADRHRAIGLAVRALRTFHEAGFTHGDAMADNVMVDLARARAHMFDFESVHDTHRSREWCRADDLRALIATCLLRTPLTERTARLRHMIDIYGDPELTARLGAHFAVFQRALPFHLGQADLSGGAYNEIARQLG